MESKTISSSPDVLSGTPVFKGTRVPFQTLLEYLEGGESIDNFLEGFPNVKREQVIAFLEEAKERMFALVKLLLDECVDQRLAKELQGHVVETVQWMGWTGIKNGQLLAFAEKQFDVLITVDRNLPFQQNLSKFTIAVLIVWAPANRLVDLKPLVPNILATLPNVQIGQTTRVGNC